MQGGNLEPAKPTNNTTSPGADGSSDAKLEYLKVYVRSVFDKYDTYQKGFLDREEFTKLLKENTGQKFSPKEVSDLISIIDANNNKLIEEN